MTVSRGCTPAEAAIAARKAREIEARLPRQPEVDMFAFLADIDRQIREARARREAAAEAFVNEVGGYRRAR